LQAIFADLMKQNYLFKHWLSTLVLAPFLASVYELIFKPISGQIVGLLEVYPIVLLFSILFSLPTLLVYFFVFRVLIKQGINPLLTKFILIALTITGIATTVLLIGGSLSATLIFAYSLTTIITGCIIRIKNKADKENSLSSV
jgi:hypothetical protein